MCAPSRCVSRNSSRWQVAIWQSVRGGYQRFRSSGAKYEGACQSLASVAEPGIGYRGVAEIKLLQSGQPHQGMTVEIDNLRDIRSASGDSANLTDKKVRIADRGGGKG